VPALPRPHPDGCIQGEPVTQRFLPTLGPDWPQLGDKVLLPCGAPGVVSTGELADPLGSDELCNLCIQGPPRELSWWLFCEPSDLVRDGEGWRL